ncbi:MAG: hypothetical protein JOY93_09415 [Acidobacteriales bacterium]|nr:hypothetical protein [Terriglobales bacterium]
MRTSTPPVPGEVDVFESIMRELRLSSGIYRTTFPNRFKKLDDEINAILASHFDRSQRIEVHDWAASDCVTSAEWAASLVKLFPLMQFTASDLLLFLIEATLPDGSAFMLESDGRPLQYVWKPFVIPLDVRESKKFPLNIALQWWARRRWLKYSQSLSIPAERLHSRDSSELNCFPFVLKKIPLVHPRAQLLQRESSSFTIAPHSAFEPLSAPCHVIRTLNIFNRVYFPEERLRQGIQNVWTSLLPGGISIIGRTYQENPPEHNASILVKENEKFRVLARFGAGSEVEDLALELRA